MRYLFLALFFFSKVVADEVVLSTKRIYLPDYPDAYNPSMIETENGILFIFRYTPDPLIDNHISYIGIVRMNDSFEPISEPQLLSTRYANSKTESQSEDPRIFSYRGRYFIVYNDNIDHTFTWLNPRRDMFIAELLEEEGLFSLSVPMRLFYEFKYNSQLMQKNWSPFEWEKNLYFSYMLSPHEVISASLMNGNCFYNFETHAAWKWNHGTLRGGTPAILVDHEYLAFFHSSIKQVTQYSNDYSLWHYYMGAYTFSAKPPFEIIKSSSEPLHHESFYTHSEYEKRVVFPGGFIVQGDLIYLAYGRDDSEMWIATIDKSALYKKMVPVL